MSAIDIDAVYAGDKEAIGDAIRILTNAAMENSGVLPVLTDKIIVPTFADNGLIIESEAGRRLASIGSNPGGSTFITGATSWFTDMVFNNRLRLGDVFSYTPSVADTAILTSSVGHLDNTLTGDDVPLGINRILYRLTPSADRTVHGIRSAVAHASEDGNNSMLIVVWNDSNFGVTFGTGVVTNDRKILGTPFAIGPQGSVVFVFDVVSNGWRPIAVNPGNWITYTPTWASTGTAPTLGNGTLTGRYTQVGKVVHFAITFVFGSSSSWGTGAHSFTLPVASLVSDLTAVSQALHAGGRHAGMGVISGAAVFLFTMASPSGLWSGTVPVTWSSASGSQCTVYGSYPVA